MSTTFPLCPKGKIRRTFFGSANLEYEIEAAVALLDPVGGVRGDGFALGDRRLCPSLLYGLIGIVPGISEIQLSVENS
jgi:hypothetical protein